MATVCASTPCVESTTSSAPSQAASERLASHAHARVLATDVHALPFPAFKMDEASPKAPWMVRVSDLAAFVDDLGDVSVRVNGRVTTLHRHLLKIGDKISTTKTISGINIAWTILSEINTAYYVVERSVNGTSFSAVGSLDATNTGKYSYMDASASGNNYYRIKAIDNTIARQGNELDFALLARFKAHGGARGDVQSHAARGVAVELHAGTSQTGKS